MYLKRETGIQSKIIQQLKMLNDLTAQKNYDYCSLGHYHCRIHHERFNYVNNDMPVTNTKTPRKLEKFLMPGNEIAFFKKMSKKIDLI